jgi:hypothetical protein
MLRIVAGAGLLLAFAALMDTSRGPADALPTMRVTFTVPEGLLVASGVVLLLAWLFLMVAARGRRKPDDEPDPESPVQWPWWRQALAQIALVAPLIATAVVLWIDDGRLANAVLALGRAFFGGADVLRDGADESPVISLPWVGWSVGFLALGIALFTLAVALLALFSDRLIAWWLARRADAEATEMADAVDESLDDLGDGADARAAIIRCYRRFEQVAARARVRREPWQTAGEFMGDLLRRLAVPDRAVERLTRLFEVARFSEHPLGPAERDLARGCLEDIRVALDRKEQAGVVA